MKLVLKIFNAVYLVLAAVAITCFLTRPYIDLKGGYTLKPDNITSLVKDSAGDDISEEEVREIVKDKTIDITLQAKVEVKYVLNFTDKEGLKNSIAVPFDEIKAKVITDATPILKDVVKKIATNVAKKVIKQSVEEKILEVRPGADTADLMSKAGLDDQYFSDFADQVYAKATEENPTIDKIMTDVIEGKMIEVATKLRDSAGMTEFLDPTEMGGEMSLKVKDQMKAKFIENKFCDADGNIVNIEEKIKSELTDKLNKTIDEYATSFSEYSLYYFIALIAFILPWAALAIFSIIRIIRRKKVWVKSWYVFAFASIQLILGVVLTIATSKFLPQIANVLPMEDFKDVLSSLTLDVKTSSFLPSILYLTMIPLTIVYMILAHKTKKNYKLEKKEAKKA